MGGAGLQLPYLGEMAPHPQTLTLILESAKTGRRTILKKAEQLEEEVICKEEVEQGEDPKPRRMQRMFVRVVGCGLSFFFFFFVGGGED
jgi:hypothetical protein